MTMTTTAPRRLSCAWLQAPLEMKSANVAGHLIPSAAQRFEARWKASAEGLKVSRKPKALGVAARWAQVAQLELA
jgi:hypothetical protein